MTAMVQISHCVGVSGLASGCAALIVFCLWFPIRVPLAPDKKPENPENGERPKNALLAPDDASLFLSRRRILPSPAPVLLFPIFACLADFARQDLPFIMKLLFVSFRRRP